MKSCPPLSHLAYVYSFHWPTFRRAIFRFYVADLFNLVRHAQSNSYPKSLDLVSVLLFRFFFFFPPDSALCLTFFTVFSKGRSTLRLIRQQKRSWMACWSQTRRRCTCCLLGWQVMTAPSPMPLCLSLSLPVQICLFDCLSVYLGSASQLMGFVKKEKKHSYEKNSSVSS